MEGIIVKDISGTGFINSGEGLYLLLVHADRIPPHIALLIGDKVYSLKVSGAEIIEAGKMLRSFGIKEIPVLFFELENSHPLADVADMMENILESLPAAGTGGLSCLAPIRILFDKIFSPEFNKIKTLFDVLPLLYAGNLVLKCHSLNIRFEQDDQSFLIRHYSEEDIKNHIAALQETKMI